MLDFKELNSDGNDFELLVRELLFSMGMRVYWSGKGKELTESISEFLKV